MAYKVIILYRLYMPSYVLGTFTEYPYLKGKSGKNVGNSTVAKSLPQNWVILPKSFI